MKRLIAIILVLAVVMGALDKLRHDLALDATNQAIDDLETRLEYKFSQIGRISTEQPETIYEIRARQNQLVDNMNKLSAG